MYHLENCFILWLTAICLLTLLASAVAPKCTNKQYHFALGILTITMIVLVTYGLIIVPTRENTQWSFVGKPVRPQDMQRETWSGNLVYPKKFLAVDKKLFVYSYDDRFYDLTGVTLEPRLSVTNLPAGSNTLYRIYDKGEGPVLELMTRP